MVDGRDLLMDGLDMMSNFTCALEQYVNDNYIHHTAKTRNNKIMKILSPTCLRQQDSFVESFIGNRGYNQSGQSIKDARNDKRKILPFTDSETESTKI